MVLIRISCQNNIKFLIWADLQFKDLYKFCDGISYPKFWTTKIK